MPLSACAFTLDCLCLFVSRSPLSLRWIPKSNNNKKKPTRKKQRNICIIFFLVWLKMNRQIPTNSSQNTGSCVFEWLAHPTHYTLKHLVNWCCFSTFLSLFLDNVSCSCALFLCLSLYLSRPVHRNGHFDYYFIVLNVQFCQIRKAINFFSECHSCMCIHK